CGRDARAPRAASPLQEMSNLQIPANAGIEFPTAGWIPAPVFTFRGIELRASSMPGCKLEWVVGHQAKA
ncbi:MAG: hypothetical protein ACRD2L_13890, partial [Terriglobia bacterium]